MKRLLIKMLTVILCVACLGQFTFQAFAASSDVKYVKEVYLSYGKTADEAKNWLTAHGYEVFDQDLNAGANDAFSDVRSVYLGYKTTDDPREAITDMKLMNMNGNYSVQDYKMLLEEQMKDIQLFIGNFIDAVVEYRANYFNGKEKAKTAHDLLNLIKDDDTGLPLGDLFLNKLKEEFTEEEYKAQPEEDKVKFADMTTILMQGNKDLILTVEQIIATATDSTDTLWLDRYRGAMGYFQMLDEEANASGDPVKAEKALAAKYDAGAQMLASKLNDYRVFLDDYLGSSVRLSDSDEAIKAFRDGVSDDVFTRWTFAGTQYEILDSIPFDPEVPEESIAAAIFNKEYDLEGEDRIFLYPMVSVLTSGQLASFEFLPFYQVVYTGMNDDSSCEAANDQFSELYDYGIDVSVYLGVDRTIFSDSVALTGDAVRLENSSEKSYTDNWYKNVFSTTTMISHIAFAVSALVTIGSAIAMTRYSKISDTVGAMLHDYMVENNVYCKNGVYYGWNGNGITPLDSEELEYFTQLRSANGYYTKWSKILTITTCVTAAITIIVGGFSIYKTVSELKKYYNVDFTPIPMHIVEETDSVFTYYDAAYCNRTPGGYTDDNNKLLKDFGDINGDVGKEWVALYTTKDSKAGDPIIADFYASVGSAKGKSGMRSLNMFGDKSAQNLTNRTAGYTYGDSKNGIYLFFGSESNILTSSVVSKGYFALAAGIGLIVGIALTSATFLLKKKKDKND